MRLYLRDMWHMSLLVFAYLTLAGLIGVEELLAKILGVPIVIPTLF